MMAQRAETCSGD